MTDSPTQTPLRADARRNRERILTAAAEVFATRGLSATLHDVAAHAGVGVGTVYRRFPDKQALVEALFDAKLDQLVATAEQAAAIDDPWTGLTRLLHDLTAFAATDHGLRQVLGSDMTDWDRFNTAREQLARITAQLLKRAQQQGVVRADVEHVDIALIWRMLTHVAQQTTPARPDAWQRYLTLVLESLRTRPDQLPLTVPPLSAAEAAAIATPLTHS